MTKRRNYLYADARHSRTGLMICNICNKPITEGPYRYYETSAAYNPQHRACTENDPKWAEIDKQAREIAERRAGFSAACAAFLSDWENEIDYELREQLEAYT